MQDVKQQLPFEDWVKGLDQLHSRSDLHGQRTTPGYEAGTSGIDLKRLYDHPHRDKLLAESRNVFGHYIMPSGFEAQPTDTRLMEGKTTEGYDFTLLAQDAKVGDDEPKTAGDVWKDFSLGGFVPYWAGAEEAGKLGKVYTAARDLEANGADADPENFKLVQEWLADQQRERTFWGGAAEMGLQMPAFIGEFMSSAGLVTAARKGATKLTGKALRELVEAQVGRLSAVRGMGLMGRGLANTAQAAAMAGVMTPRAQASAWRRAMPEMALQEDAEAASIVMMGTSKEFTEALPAGYIDTWIEVMSEKAGELTIGALAKVPYVNKLGVFQASMMKRYLDKNPTRTTRDFLEMVSKESGWTRVVNEIGIQDPFTEVAEERLGDAMRTAILGDEWDWPSAEQFAQELVVFSGLGVAKAPATFRNQRRTMEALERQAQAEEQQTERNRQVFEGKERGEEIAGKDRDGKQAVVTQVGEGTYRLVNEDGTLDITVSAESPEEAIEQMGKLGGFQPDTEGALQGPEEAPDAPEPTPVQEAEEQPGGQEAAPEEPQPIEEPQPEPGGLEGMPPGGMSRDPLRQEVTDLSQLKPDKRYTIWERPEGGEWVVDRSFLGEFIKAQPGTQDVLNSDRHAILPSTIPPTEAVALDQPKKLQEYIRNNRKFVTDVWRVLNTLDPTHQGNLSDAIQQRLGREGADEWDRQEAISELEWAGYTLDDLGGTFEDVLDAAAVVSMANSDIEVAVQLADRASIRDHGGLKYVELDRERHLEAIKAWHSKHHKKGDDFNYKFQDAVAVLEGDKVAAVALLGTPTARWGEKHGNQHIELIRVISSGSVKNASSAATSAAIQLAKQYGKTLVTYTETHEAGTSYKALQSKRKDGYHLRPTELRPARPDRKGKLGAPKVRWEAGPLAGEAINVLEQSKRGGKPKVTFSHILSRHLDKDKLDLTPEERDFGFRTAIPELDELNRVEPDPTDRKAQLKLYDALQQALVGSGQDVDAVLAEATERGYGQQARDVLEAFATGVSELREANSLEVETAPSKWTKSEIADVSDLLDEKPELWDDADAPDVVIRSSTGRVIGVGYKDEPLDKDSSKVISRMPQVFVSHDYDMTDVRLRLTESLVGRAGEAIYRASSPAAAREMGPVMAQLGFVEAVENPEAKRPITTFARQKSDAEKRVERSENARRRWEEHRASRGGAEDATFIEWLSLIGGAYNDHGDLDNWARKEAGSLGLPVGWSHPVKKKGTKREPGGGNDYILDAMVDHGWASSRAELDAIGNPEDVILDFLERNPRANESTRLEEEEAASSEEMVQRAMDDLGVSREMAEALASAPPGEAFFIPVRDLKSVMGEEEAEFALEMGGIAPVADLVSVADVAVELETLDDIGQSKWMSMSFEERDRLAEESAFGVWDWSEDSESEGDPWDEDPGVTVAEMPRTDPDMFGETEEKEGTRPETGDDTAVQGKLIDEDTGQRGQTSLLDEEFQEPTSSRKIKEAIKKHDDLIESIEAGPPLGPPSPGESHGYGDRTKELRGKNRKSVADRVEALGRMEGPYKGATPTSLIEEIISLMRWGRPSAISLDGPMLGLGAIDRIASMTPAAMMKSSREAEIGWYESFGVNKRRARGMAREKLHKPYWGVAIQHGAVAAHDALDVLEKLKENRNRPSDAPLPHPEVVNWPTAEDFVSRADYEDAVREGGYLSEDRDDELPYGTTSKASKPTTSQGDQEMDELKKLMSDWNDLAEDLDPKDPGGLDDEFAMPEGPSKEEKRQLIRKVAAIVERAVKAGVTDFGDLFDMAAQASKGKGVDYLKLGWAVAYKQATPEARSKMTQPKEAARISQEKIREITTSGSSSRSGASGGVRRPSEAGATPEQGRVPVEDEGQGVESAPRVERPAPSVERERERERPAEQPGRDDRPADEPAPEPTPEQVAPDVEAISDARDRADRFRRLGRGRVSELSRSASALVNYEALSSMDAQGLLMSGRLGGIINQGIKELALEVGDIDAWVADKLGYESKNDLKGKLYSEQVDAVALGIRAIEKGEGIIIGDETGTGKGRISAALVRYAQQQGLVGVWITKGLDLYKDASRDFAGIGMNADSVRMVATNNNLNVQMDSGFSSTPLSQGSMKKRLEDATRALKMLVKPAPDASKGEREKYSKELRRIIGGNTVMSTYSQLGPDKNAEGRVAFMEALAPHAVIVMDESHNAAGSPKKTFRPPGRQFKIFSDHTSDIFRRIVSKSQGGVFLSATFAKSAENFGLYMTTPLGVYGRHVGSAIATGGVPMLQHVSSALADSLSMVRRQRDFTGATFEVNEVEGVGEGSSKVFKALEMLMELDRNLASIKGPMSSRLSASSKVGLKLLSDMKEGDLPPDLAGYRWEVKPDKKADKPAQQLGLPNFLHSMMSTVMLAIKARQVAVNAVKARKEGGYKVMIALQKTGESALLSHIESNGIEIGDDVGSYGIKDALLAQLERSRIVTYRARAPIHDATKDKDQKWLAENLSEYEDQHKYVLTPADTAERSPEFETLFEETREYIESLDLSDIPGSPIDEMISVIEEAGLAVGELTGRTRKVVDGKLQARSRTAHHNTETIAAFNGDGVEATIDVLIGNSSVDTGVSMHSSKDFGDTSPRLMLLAEMFDDVNGLMQMLGRIGRAGQVHPPTYHFVSSDIPAERRYMAQTTKRLAKLSSTSTGEESGSFDLSIDFINRFGDQVVTEFLRANSDLRARMNISVPDDGVEDGVAGKVALRAVTLQPEEQLELFDQLEENYVSLLEARSAMGEEITGTRSLDLDAVLLERHGFLPAIIEGNEDELTGPTFIERIDVKRQFKPESPEALDEKYPTGGLRVDVEKLKRRVREEWEPREVQLSEKLDEIKAEAQAKLERRQERQEEAHAKRVEAARKAGELLPDKPDALEMAKADEQRISAAIRGRAQSQGAINEIDRLLTSLMENQYIFLLPKGGTMDDFAEATAYRFIGARISNEKARPESMSRYTVKLYGHEGIVDLPLSALRSESDVTIGVTNRRVWTEQIRSGMHGREERYILTGNLIHPSMVGATHGGVMVEYTARVGDSTVLRQGVLLPKAFSPSKVQPDTLLPESYVGKADELKEMLQEGISVRMAVPLNSANVRYNEAKGQIEIVADATQAVRSVLYKELPRFIEYLKSKGQESAAYRLSEGSSGRGKEREPDVHTISGVGGYALDFVDWAMSSDVGPGIRFILDRGASKTFHNDINKLKDSAVGVRGVQQGAALKEDVELDAPPVADEEIDAVMAEAEEPDIEALKAAPTGSVTWYGSDYSGIRANMGESLYNGKILSRQELTVLATEVVTSRKMVTRFGTNQRNRIGFYSRGLDITRVKEAHDAATQAHELGHAVQQDFFPEDKESLTGYSTTPEGWLGEAMKDARKAFHQELMDLGRKAYGSTKPKGGYKSEGWAEFFRLYMTKPEMAQSLAPTVYSWFHGEIRRNHPEMYEAIEKYRSELRKRILASPQQRALVDQAKADSMLTRRHRLKEYWRPDDKWSGRSFIVDWIDQNHPFRELDAFVESKIREEGNFGYQLLNKDGLLRPSQSIYRTAGALQMTHAARAAFFVDHYTTDIAGNRVGEPLGKLKEWITPREWKDFAIYLWARRALALANHPDYASIPETQKVRESRQGGLSVDEALALVRNLEEGRSLKFQKAAEHVYRWNNDLLNYAAGASKQMARAVARIRSIDPGNYVPLWNVFQQLDGSYRAGSGRGVKDAQTGRLAKRLRGSMNVPTNVMVSMLQNAEHIIKTTHQRVILERIYQYRNVPGVGHLIEELPAKQDSHSATVHDLVTKLNKALGGVKVMKDKQDPETGDHYWDDLEMEDLAVMASFFFPVMKTGDDSVRFVMIDEGQPTGDIGPTGKRDNQRYKGKIKLFELKDPLLLEALLGEDPSQTPNIIATIFMGHARLWRLGTVAWRASFGWVTNPQRDVRTFWMQTRVQGNPVWNWALVKDLIGMMASTFMYQVASEKSRAKFPKWMEENAKWLDRFYSLGGEIATPVGEDINMARRSAARITQSPFQRAANPKNWLDWLATMVQIPEGAIRATELKNVAKMKEITSSQYFTPDMAIEMAEASSEVTVNFRRGGLRARSVNRYVPFFTATINGWVDMIGAYNRNPGQFILKGMTSIMFPAIAAWMLIRDEEWYKELPANMKFQYLYLKIGDDVVQIRQPHETGTFFGSSIIAMLESAYRDGENSMDDFGWFAAQTMFPSLAPPLASEIIEQASNYDYFFDRPIVPRSMDGRVYARDQYGPYTTWSAKAIGNIFNVSPLRIDHAVRGIFGSAVPDAIRSSEALLGLTTRKRNAEPSDIPIIGSTFRRGGATVTQSKTIDELYDLKEKAELIQFSPSVEETESQRQRRLLVSDATRAIGLLSYVRQYTEGRAERGALTREMVGIAKDAVEAYNGDMWIGNDRHFLRQRMRSIRKQAQRRKEFAQ